MLSDVTSDANTALLVPDTLTSDAQSSDAQSSLQSSRQAVPVPDMLTSDAQPPCQTGNHQLASVVVFIY